MDVQLIRRLRDLLVWIAGGGLLVAVVIDALAMLGRQIQFPLLGSIEIVQAAVLIAACGALVVASLDSAHARVNILLDRMPGNWREQFRRLHVLAAILLYASLLIGTVWIAADLWSGHEESELLHIPYRPLRIAAAAALATLLVLAVLSLRRRSSK